MLLLDSDIKASVAAFLKTAVAAMPTYWDAVIARAHVSGWQDVMEALLRRDFTRAQIEAWDRAAEFEESQSVYYAVIRGAGAEAFDLSAIRLWDRRKDLMSIQVYIDGVYIDPAAGAAGPGVVNHGPPAGGAPPEQFPPSGFNW